MGGVGVWSKAQSANKRQPIVMRRIGALNMLCTHLRLQVLSSPGPQDLRGVLRLLLSARLIEKVTVEELVVQSQQSQ